MTKGDNVNRAVQPFLFSKRENFETLRTDADAHVRALEEHEIDQASGASTPWNPNSTTCAITSCNLLPHLQLCLADDTVSDAH